MPQCCVPLCFNRSETNPKLSFYRIPKPLHVRARWLKSIRREKEFVSAHCRICSWHFPRGKDAGPIRFKWNERKFMNFGDPEKQEQEVVSGSSSSHSSSSNNLYMLATVCENAEKQDLENFELQQKLLECNKQREILKDENSTLRWNSSLKLIRLTVNTLQDDMIALYTTLPNKDTFNLVVRVMKRFPTKYHSNWNVKILPIEDQVLLSLMKLHLNLPNLDLAVRFNISIATVTNIFQTIIEVMHTIFFKGFLSGKLPSLQHNQKSAPESFRYFPTCRIVIGCTEVHTVIPEDLDKCCQSYSHYKKGNTLKALVGISPNGTITFVSDLYGGCTSDKAISKHCGLLDLLNPGDMILADKGLAIESVLPQGITVNHPSFLCNPQFTAQEVAGNKEMAHAQSHVERAIQQIKTFHMLDFIPPQHRSIANKIFQCACCMANLQQPIIADGHLQ